MEFNTTVINTSYIQKNSHTNKFPDVFTTLEIKSVPIHIDRSEKEVHPSTETHIPPATRHARTYKQQRKSTNPLKCWEIPLLEVQ